MNRPIREMVENLRTFMEQKPSDDDDADPDDLPPRRGPGGGGRGKGPGGPAWGAKRAQRRASCPYAKEDVGEQIGTGNLFSARNALVDRLKKLAGTVDNNLTWSEDWYMDLRTASRAKHDKRVQKQLDGMKKLNDRLDAFEKAVHDLAMEA